MGMNPWSVLGPGAYTFLFTDIEGSTARWEADPAGMKSALKRHNQIIKRHAGVYEARGWVFSWTGDGFCVCFEPPRNAVLAAVNAQRALTTGLDIRVRMALHTGFVDVIEEGFCGPTLNRVARMLGCARGGVILASQATHDALGEKLLTGKLVDEGIKFQPVGSVRLRDISEELSVYRISAAGLPDVDAPLDPWCKVDVSHGDGRPKEGVRVRGRDPREAGERAPGRARRC